MTSYIWPLIALTALLLWFPGASMLGRLLGKRSAIKVERTLTEWERRYPKG